MKYCLFLTFLLLTCSVNAQKQAANWYFGARAGIDFNSGAPVPHTDGALTTQEGCATISDFNGNLLFYTDGIDVWNRNHSRMPNGFDLKGHPSSTQSGLIVPHPGNPDLYYIFTADQGGDPNGLQYNIVDMTLQGGLGDVGTKNILLNNRVTEKLTAVENANGTGFWLIAHEYGSDEFLTYAITPTGLNTTPIISAIGENYHVLSNGRGSRGQLKISPDGRYLASASSGSFHVELFRFDTATGVVSDPVLLDGYFAGLPTGDRGFPYGVEFSSDGNRLYISQSAYDIRNQPTSSIHQFDVSNYNQAAIVASGNIIAPKQSIEIGMLQLAIDGKIYVARFDENALGVINNPNVLGMGSGYVDNAIPLGGRLSRLGLPPFIQSYFIVGFQARNFCLGDATEFTVNSSDPIVSISWDFGDGNTSMVESPSHSYGSSGTYTVSVSVTTASETKTETKDITIYEIPVANAITNFELCSATASHQFDLSTKYVELLGTQLLTENNINYYSSSADANNGMNPLPVLYTNTNSTETIFARISNRNNPLCYDITSFDLFVKEAPVLHTVPDWVVCDTDTDGLFNFDLTTKDVAVLNGQSATTFAISYYLNQSDADAKNSAIGSNYTNTTSPEQIFFRIENTAHPECYETGSFTLEVITAVIAVDPPDLEVCDDNNDGLFSFDLSLQDATILGTQNPTNFDVSYYRTQSDANNGANSLNRIDYTNTSPYVETVYARVENNGHSDCYNTVSFSLRIYDSPEVQPVSRWEVCDDNNDGVSNFDLTTKGSEILGTQSTAQFNVSYFTSAIDADLNQNSISGNFQNTANPQTIYFRIENIGDTNCYVTDSFELEIFDTPNSNQPTTLIVCDTNETGTQTFDLSTKDTEVLNGQSATTFELLYFSNLSDAHSNSNALPKNGYENTQLQETIYARIQNRGMNSCYEVTSFELMVNPLPQPNLEKTYVICPDSPELTIDGGDFESWSWRDVNGSILTTNKNINITQLGDYTLTVTETQNSVSCEKTVDFEVVSSGAPEDFTTEIKDFSDVVTVEVDVIGIGDFEYSADGENFQDSNRLEVFPGVHTIYVRDKFLCRTITKEIIALGFQKFFTPNGDGTHDYWNIIGVENFPTSKTYIFDRHGKLLRQLSPESRGWDGTFQGVQMPATDYWFRFENEDGSVHTGHFSLKR